MTVEANHLDRLVELLRHTEPRELDCDEILDQVAPLAEAHRAGSPLTAELRAVEQHLRVCPECHEEFEALLAAL